MHWEMDFNAFKIKADDPFAEVPVRTKFEKLLNEIWN